MGENKKGTIYMIHNLDPLTAYLLKEMGEDIQEVKIPSKTIVTKQKINIDEITKQVEEKVKERLMRSTSQAWG